MAPPFLADADRAAEGDAGFRLSGAYVSGVNNIEYATKELKRLSLSWVTSRDVNVLPRTAYCVPSHLALAPLR